MVPGIVDPLRSQTNISNLPTVTQEGSAVVEDRPCAAEELALVEGPPALIENRPLVKNHPAVESPPAAIEDLPVIAISDDLPALVLEHAPFVLKDLSAILPGGLATSHLSDSSTFSSMSDCSTTMRFTPSRIPRLASLSSLRRATILDARTQSTVPDPSTASATCNRSISSVEPTVFTASTLSTPPSVTRHTISSYAHMKFYPPLPFSPSPASPKPCVGRLPSLRCTSSTTIRVPRRFHDGSPGETQRQN
ncbi:hypothetical protein PLICRDRAFT_169680 [Plicaturopsis crispa FD-325 SS-3]|nr:hypothetical protein PLICRDRAFT_169680 [Plicaturopsis crispa FD-325 SS-3]